MLALQLVSGKIENSFRLSSHVSYTSIYWSLLLSGLDTRYAAIDPTSTDTRVGLRQSIGRCTSRGPSNSARKIAIQFA